MIQDYARQDAEYKEKFTEKKHADIYIKIMRINNKQNKLYIYICDFYFYFFYFLP